MKYNSEHSTDKKICSFGMFLAVKKSFAAIPILE
jgi:hypothetical protein